MSVKDIDLALIKPILQEFQQQEGAVIPILQRTQELYGYLPEEAMQEISKESGVSLSQLYGVATFYAQFRFSPIGRNHIMVCRGTACHVRGAERIRERLHESLNIADGQTTEDGRYTLESVRCIGCCSLGPVMKVNEDMYGRIATDEVEKVLGHYE